MPHANAPLSGDGRRRLVKRCQSRPVAHVAAEMGISRACASEWVNRWRLHGDAGLHDQPSSPHRSPNATPAWVIEQIESWRREHKWSAQRITDELVSIGFVIDRRTVGRHLSSGAARKSSPPRWPPTRLPRPRGSTAGQNPEASSSFVTAAIRAMTSAFSARCAGRSVACVGRAETSCWTITCVRSRSALSRCAPSR